MSCRKFAALTVVLLLILSFSATAQEVTPAAKKLRLKSISMAGVPQGSRLMDAIAIGDDVLYAFSSWVDKASAPGMDKDHVVTLKFDNFSTTLRPGIANGNILKVLLEYRFDEAPITGSVDVAIALTARENDKTTVNIVAGNVTVPELMQGGEKQLVDRAQIYRFSHNPDEKISINDISLAQRNLNGTTEILVGMNYLDRIKEPYHYNTKTFALGYSNTSGLASGVVNIITPGKGNDTALHFARPSKDVVVAYRQKYKAPTGENIWPFNDGGTILLGKNNPSFSYASAPATKLRLKDRIKGTDAYTSYPARQPRFIDWHDGSLALIYQILTSDFSSMSSTKTDYYYALINSSKARLAKKPVQLKWPAWKRLIKEAQNVSTYYHYSTPSYFVPMGEGKYALLETFTYMRKPYSNQAPAAKPQHTEIQGRVLLFDSNTLETRIVKTLKIKYKEFERISQVWALERGDEIDFIILLKGESWDDYEAFIGTMKKADIK